MQRPICLATAISAACLPAAAGAAIRIAPIVLTASRLPITADDALASVTVITRKEIEATNAQSVGDMLRVLPGIDVVSSGGLGGNTSVFLRGANSNQVLVLIDGVRADSPNSGLFAWRSLSPEQIERIEIVRGPRATLYGSEAIGGVIQIFTRHPHGVTAAVEAGSYDTQRAEAGIGVGETRQLDLNASFTRTDGFSATNPSGFNHDPDNDGYLNRSLNGRFTTPLWGEASLRLTGWYANGNVEFDQGTQHTVNGNYSARLSDSPATIWDYALTIGFNQDDIKTKSDFPSKINTWRTTLDWQNNLRLAQTQTLTLGLDWRRDAGKNLDTASSSVVFNDSIDNQGVYANWLAIFGASDLEAGARYDHYSSFGGQLTGQLAWGVHFGSGYRVFASFGTAFRAPSLNELFHPGIGGYFAGNPDLKPERSRSAELGLQYRQPGGRRQVQANFFYTWIHDLIAFEGNQNQAINVDKARIPGLELQYADGFGRWSLNANLTLQRPRNLTTDSRLLRRPDRKFSLAVARALGDAGQIRGEMLTVGKRTDVGNEVLGGYTLFNLSSRIRLSPGWAVEARIENLTDKEYEDAFGFNTSGRAFYLGIRYAAAQD